MKQKKELKKTKEEILKKVKELIMGEEIVNGDIENKKKKVLKAQRKQ